MRSHLIIALLLLTASCGKKTVNKYIENPYNDSDISDRVSQLEEQIQWFSNNLAQNATKTQELADRLELLDESNMENAEEISTIKTDLYFTQGTAILALERIAELETQEKVVEFIDPCGPTNGYDEVILRMNSGKLLAYFESGTQRYLTVLKKNQSYRTTDAQSCNFSVNTQGVLVW